MPVSLHYRTGDGRPSTATAFIGDDTLVASMLRILRLGLVRVSVHLRPALFAGPCRHPAGPGSHRPGVGA